MLAATYAYFFTDWFHKKTIQIIPSIRPIQASAIPRDPDQPPVYPVSFALDGKYELTAVKVVVASDLATNKYAAPLWHLDSESNSIPTRSIVYGSNIKGMKPAVERKRPEPLMPEVEYTLLVEAGNLKSQTNFHTARAVARGR